MGSSGLLDGDIYHLCLKAANPGGYGTQPKLTLTQPGKWVSKIRFLRVYHGFFNGCDANHRMHRSTRFLHKGNLE
jgi:hypothetical protein